MRRAGAQHEQRHRDQGGDLVLRGDLRGGGQVRVLSEPAARRQGCHQAQEGLRRGRRHQGSGIIAHQLDVPRVRG